SPCASASLSKNFHCPTTMSQPASSKPDRADVTTLTAAEIAQAVASGKLRASTVIADTLARIAKDNPLLNAFTDVTAERATNRAKDIDAAITAGKPAGALAGVPFAVKNLFDVKGLPTRAGSKINRELAQATHDAVLIERLEAAGAILVGALNM